MTSPSTEMAVLRPESRRPTGAEYQKLKNKTRLWFRGSLLAATFAGAAYMGWKNEADLVTSYSAKFDGSGPRLDANEFEGRSLSSLSSLNTLTRRSLNASCDITSKAPDARENETLRVEWQATGERSCCRKGAHATHTSRHSDELRDAFERKPLAVFLQVSFSRREG